MTIVNLHPRLLGRSDSCRALLAVLAAALAFAYPAGAQEPDALSSSEVAFGEEIDVRVVNLEVVVEDRDGERVRDLRRDDFRVFVDGDEVDVEYFTEVAQGRASDDNGETPPAVGEGGAVVTNYVLFVDDDHSLAAFRRPVLDGFGNGLAELPSQDQIAVIVQSRNRLELLSPFTMDREATRAALAEIDREERFGGVLKSPRFHRDYVGGSPGRGPSNRVTGLSVRRVAGATGGPAPPGAAWDVRRDGPGSGGEGGFERSDAGAGADGTAADRLSAAGIRLAEMTPQSLADEAMGSILERDLTLSVNAVISAMRALEQPEGRKVLLLLAGRWPAGVFRPGGRGSELRTDLDLLDGLIDTANLLGYTVYPLDQQASAPYMTWWQNLRYMARDTGGMAFMAGSNLDALARVSEDTSNYYWLGFAPEYRRDDRVHEIEVEVLRPGLEVRARRGYVDLSRKAEAEMEAQRALLFPRQGAPAAAALTARVGIPRKLSRRRMAVPIDIEVPLGVFPALPYGNEYLQRLEVRFATIDDAGWRAEQPAIPLELRSRSAPRPDTVFDYYAEVTMRHLPHTVVVTVHDPVSRETASARLEVVP
ncbi:MAG: VWA domain-containing protein [Acidobacteria bacterium]|nr:VWA domain-containing protein [Acidobacteriota bacterium]